MSPTTVAFAFLLAVLGVVAASAPAGAADRVASIPGYPPLQSNNYAGYLATSNQRKAFYWFLESQGTPSTDPLVLWLNGGPGCSSLMALAEENGPYQMRHGGQFVKNEYAWNKLANVLYIESPAGVGFSVDSVPPTAWDDNATAAFNYEALKSFFVKFPQYAQHKFWIAGESYAGFYVPELAQAILDGDDATIRGQMQGFMVGNPCTGTIGCPNDDPTLLPFLQYNGFASFRSDVKADPAARYNPYDLLVPSCDNDALADRIRFGHPMIEAYKKRRAASSASSARTTKQTAGRAVGGAPAPYGPCADQHVHAWLNRADVKAAIHADANITWRSCSNIQYAVNMKGVVPIYQRIMDTTSWKVMIFSGLSDSIVNQAQTRRVINSEMNRPVASDVFDAWYHPYVYNTTQTELGGFFQLYDRIAWAGVRNAGHMVPQFNPPAAFELFRSFLTTGKPGRLSD